MKEMDREYEQNNNANMDNGVFNTEDDKSRQSLASQSVDNGQGGGAGTKERVNESMELDGRYLKREEDNYNVVKSEIEQVRSELVRRKVIEQLQKRGHKNVERDHDSGIHNYATAAFHLLRAAYMNNPKMSS